MWWIGVVVLHFGRRISSAKFSPFVVGIAVELVKGKILTRTGDEGRDDDVVSEGTEKAVVFPLLLRSKRSFLLV
jgi:hypothetical protein